MNLAADADVLIVRVEVTVPLAVSCTDAGLSEQVGAVPVPEVSDTAQASATELLYPRMDLIVTVDDAAWPPVIGLIPAACTEKSGP